MNSLKKLIQEEYDRSKDVESLKAKHGAELVRKYIEDQLCVQCENELFTQYDHTDEQVCDACAKACSRQAYPERRIGESDSEYWTRVGEYAAGLDDYDVARLEYELFSEGE